MQKAEAQHNQMQNQPAQRQGKGASLESPQGEQIAQLEVLADCSPQAAAQRRLMGMVHNSPLIAAQRKAISAIHNSPNVAAQRRQLDNFSGETAQREETEEPLPAEVTQREVAPAKPNNTGLPDNLKSGIESLSGMSMDSVRVHYNSSQPAQLNALAYAQGTDIHVGPGQEKHLPHEAWHVVQQAQGRVRPTMQMKDGVQVNDDEGLENEADSMGTRALGVGEVAQKVEGASVGMLEVLPSATQDGTGQSEQVNQLHSFQRVSTGEALGGEHQKFSNSFKTNSIAVANPVQMMSEVIQRSGLSSQLRNVFTQAGAVALFQSIDGAQGACNGDPDVHTLLGQILAGDQLWLGQQHLAHGAEVGWPFHVALERTVKAGGAGVAGAHGILNGDNGAHAADALSIAALGRMFNGNALWHAQKLLEHGPTAGWPFHVTLEAHMKTGAGKAAAFSALRADNAAHAADLPTTNAIARMFQGEDLWYAQQLQAYGLETGWPAHIKIEKEARPDGGGHQRIYELLQAYNGVYAANANVTLAITAAFTAGSNELWYAQQLQAFGVVANWTSDLKAEKEIRKIDGDTNWTNVMALMVAATQVQFNNVMNNLPQTHNSKLIEMLYAANGGDFDTFMRKMDRAQTVSFLANVSTWNSLYYKAFLARIKTSRMLATTASWVGHLEWRGGSGPDDADNYQIKLTTAWGNHNHFAHWLRNGGPEPNNNSTMNCWEAVMFMAYRSGLVSKQWLADIHIEAAQAGNTAASTNDYFDVLRGRLGVDSAAAWTYNVPPPGTPNIPAGNLIFMNGLSHVLMSQGTRDGNGRQKVYSMWLFPLSAGIGGARKGWMQDTTLEEIMISSGHVGDAVTFKAPPW